jgi:Leucine-rich repeat (LRR) protein
MPKRPSKEPLRDPATEEALRRIEEARKTGARRLDLSDLKLSTLPEAIGQLAALTKLWLRRNQLKALPPEIGQLTALKEFSAAQNQLKELPDIFGAFRDLRKLWLDQNQIKELPKSVGQLEADLQDPRAGLKRGCLTDNLARLG